MTVVCCWLDNSYGRSRITSIADARISSQLPNGNWVKVSDNTTKLFSISIRCHSANSFDADTSRLTNPYFQTDICIGFSGYCTEAFSIISLFQRAVSQLASEDEDNPKPEARGLLVYFSEIAKKYLHGHTNASTQRVEFLLFGFDAINNNPWVGRVAYDPSINSCSTDFRSPIDENDIYWIGDKSVVEILDDSVRKTRSQILRHKNALKLGDGDDAFFEYQKSTAQHDSADKKIIEQRVLDAIHNKFLETVGGAIQKMEIYGKEDHAAVASHCSEIGVDFFDGLPSISNFNLFFLKVCERMGR
jgi:hypothetical protein